MRALAGAGQNNLLRSVLLMIIIATFPFYCIGIAMFALAPDQTVAEQASETETAQASVSSEPSWTPIGANITRTLFPTFTPLAATVPGATFPTPNIFIPPTAVPIPTQVVTVFVPGDPTSAPSLTPIPTLTPLPSTSPVPQPSNTSKPPNTPIPPASDTPIPPASNTPQPTNTEVPPPTDVPPTNTPIPSNTPQPTNTEVPPPTDVPPTDVPPPTATVDEGIILPPSDTPSP